MFRGLHWANKRAHMYTDLFVFFVLIKRGQTFYKCSLNSFKLKIKPHCPLRICSLLRQTVDKKEKVKITIKYPKYALVIFIIIGITTQICRLSGVCRTCHFSTSVKKISARLAFLLHSSLLHFTMSVFQYGLTGD